MVSTTTVDYLNITALGLDCHRLSPWRLVLPPWGGVRHKYWRLVGQPEVLCLVSVNSPVESLFYSRIHSRYNVIQTNNCPLPWKGEGSLGTRWDCTTPSGAHATF